MSIFVCLNSQRWTARNDQHLIFLEGQDFAGNKSETVDVKLWCDKDAPTVVFAPLSYRQEFAGAHIDVKDSDPPALLEKYIHNLDDSSDNLPTIRFVVDDQIGRNIGSNPNRIQVEYAYAYDDGGATQYREWEPLAVTENGHYDLKISYQALLPQAFKAMSLAQVRERNFVAFSRDTDLHTVKIRATDESGNTSSPVEFKFKMSMRSNPVYVDCKTSVEAANARLDPPTVVDQAQVGGRMFDIKYRWPAATFKEASWAPQKGSLSVSSPTTMDMSWVVWRKEMQLKRTYGAVDCAASGIYCPDPSIWGNWHIQFDDGECLNRQYSFWGGSQGDQAVTTHVYDSHDVFNRTGRAGPGDARSIWPGDEFRQPYHANEAVPLVKHDNDAYGRSRTQIFGRRGEECALRDRGRPARPIENIRGNALEHHDFVMKMQVRRPPLSKPSVLSLGAFPEPSAIVVGEECKKTAVAEYEGANAPKVFYE